MTSWLIGLRDWVDDRLPIMRAWNTHMGQYYAPKNFNFWYFFGVLSLLVLVNQLLTGIWLTMFYTPTAEGAFASVEYIMRDIDYGWIIRYMHSTGASAFFAVVYLHMFRGLLYGSYKKPRELVWLFGMLIYLCLMAEGFMGYVLPWGQMSYWGAQVIVSLFGAIPVVGESIVQWVRGDFLISGATLNRFFALHVVAIPLILVMLVVLHLLALHEVGSNNPDGIEIKKNKGANGKPLDGIPFHPYYTVHDLVGIAVFLFVFCFILFFMPEMGGYFLEYANFEEANPLKTPAHIAPVWYYTPFYAMLRATTLELFGLPAKFWGFMVMAGAIAIMFVLPWLDRSKVKSWRYKGMGTKVALYSFAISFLVLGYLGAIPSGGLFLANVIPHHIEWLTNQGVTQTLTVVYFLFFLLMPIYTSIEKTKPEPQRVTMK
jgi:ubiquinol-cytochrome c reductase cytochrome b subunit